MLATAVFVLLAALFFATRPAREDIRYFTAILPRADGVREGTVVTFLGVEVGFVERLRIDDGKVIAQLRVQREDARVRRDDTLRLRPNGIFGGMTLDWVPGSRQAPPLADGDTIVALRAPDVSLWGVIDSLLDDRQRDGGGARPAHTPR
jgi:ABC-type transporter Mla subunit MlaD